MSAFESLAARERESMPLRCFRAARRARPDTSSEIESPQCRLAASCRGTLESEQEKHVVRRVIFAERMLFDHVEDQLYISSQEDCGQVEMTLNLNLQVSTPKCISISSDVGGAEDWYIPILEIGLPG